MAKKRFEDPISPLRTSNNPPLPTDPQSVIHFTAGIISPGCIFAWTFCKEGNVTDPIIA